MLKITKGHVVSLSYVLRQENEVGPIIQETNSENPLVFLFGFGQMLPDFEKNIEGKSIGETYSFGILAENAYGLYDPEGIMDLPIEIFFEEGKLVEDFIIPGKTIRLSDDEGNIHMAVVKGRSINTVQVDFNHPLAGKNLHFSVKILSVREASPDELAHGHVHGPGGVDHH